MHRMSAFALMNNSMQGVRTHVHTFRHVVKDSMKAILLLWSMFYVILSPKKGHTKIRGNV